MYVPELSSWFVYGDSHWVKDLAGMVTTMAIEAARTFGAQAHESLSRLSKGDERSPAEEAEAGRLRSHAAWAKSSEMVARINATLEIAKTLSSMTVAAAALDSDPWVFNVRNGTFDLQTGKLRPHDSRDFITRCAPVLYDPSATCPHFNRFFDRIQPDRDVGRHIQKVVGYSLTGSTAEQRLFIFLGRGANGKSTLLTTMQALFGAYGVQAPHDLLLASANEPHPTGLMTLRGARVAVVSEVNPGQRFNEQRVKALTGGDTISARAMYHDHVNFAPTAKLFMGVNHLPEVQSTDDGIWRRFDVADFKVQIPEDERDANLGDKLRGELPGILNWALEGLRLYLAEGLKQPAAVKAAGSAYRRDQDMVGQFIEERCVTTDSLAWTASRDLLTAFSGFCADEGLPPPKSRNLLSQRLGQLGFANTKGAQDRRGYKGISIRQGNSRIANERPRDVSACAIDAADTLFVTSRYREEASQYVKVLESASCVSAPSGSHGLVDGLSRSTTLVFRPENRSTEVVGDPVAVSAISSIINRLKASQDNEKIVINSATASLDVGGGAK